MIFWIVTHASARDYMVFGWNKNSTEFRTQINNSCFQYFLSLITSIGKVEMQDQFDSAVYPLKHMIPVTFKLQF